MDSTVMLALVLFLIGMALVAGAGIGCIVGLAVGRRGDEPGTTVGAAAAPSSGEQRPYACGGLAEREVQTKPRTTTSWSVALAFGVILVCCTCTFLTAVAVTLGR